MKPSHTPSNRIGVWTLSLVNFAAVLSIVNFPAQAEYGYQIVFYITMSAICFFVPTALVSAELASGWPRNGGVYLWVKEAFGPQWGFVTVFMQWLNSLPWFATVLTFIATATAYVFHPALAQNRWFVFLVIAGCMILCTVLNFRGIKFYSKLASIGAAVGTLFPAAVIIILAALFLGSGHAPAIPFSIAAALPRLEGLNDWMLLAGMMVALAGIDMPAVHVNDVENPQRNFPKAIWYSSILIILLSIFGSLSIALIVPPAQLSMASGAPQAFSRMLGAFHLEFLSPVMCLFLICGALTTVFTWTLGPSKGLLEVARDGHIPAYWQEVNRFGIPVHILVLQCIVPIMLATVVFFMPTIGGAFWLMMAFSAQLYMTMYLFIFAAAIRLRFNHPEVKRPYQIPGGKIGMIIVAGMGFLTSLVAMLAGFIPPESIRAKGWGASLLYVGGLALVTGFFITTALVTCHYQARRNAHAESRHHPAD